MAIRNLEDIPKEAKFGRRLFIAAERNNLLGPAQIAEAVYDNDKCFKLAKPGGRAKKYPETKKKDIGAIVRRVQEHFNCTGADEVSSAYILIYSQLLHCSTDYLYGLIDIPAPDAKIADICEKTGLSEKAVENLMSGDEIYLDEYLRKAFEYGFAENNPCKDKERDSGENDELYDGLLEIDSSISKFWSNILESEQFKSIPDSWYRMTCALYTSRAVAVVAKSAKEDLTKMPTKESFIDNVENWNLLHEHEPVCIPDGLNPEGAYDRNPDWAKSTYREINYENYYSAIDRNEDCETAYWGCAGRFDRAIQDYFHKCADEWCVDGPLISLKEDK